MYRILTVEGKIQMENIPQFDGDSDDLLDDDIDLDDYENEDDEYLERSGSFDL